MMAKNRKAGPLRNYRVYVDGKLEATISTYTMKSACHQAKQRFSSQGDIHVAEF